MRTWPSVLLVGALLVGGPAAAEATAAPEADEVPAAPTAAPGTVVAAAAAAPTLVARAGASGRDYAEEVFGDPWDYRDQADLMLDANVMGLSAPVLDRAGDGTAEFTVSGGAYVSPLWPGYPGSLLNGRDGAAPGNRLDSDTYDRISFHAYAERDVSSGVMWFDCPGGGLGPSCGGGLPFGLKQGWHTYTLTPGASVYPGWPEDWRGGVTGLRLALSPSSPTRVELDWMRVYDSGTASVARWQHPGGGGQASLVWDRDDSTANNTASAPGWGVVTSSSTATTDTDLSALPAGTYWLRSRSSAGWSPAARVDIATPGAVVQVPDRYGEVELGALTGHRWDMSEPSDVSVLNNASGASFAGGRLSATNAGPLVNDPHLFLSVPATIDAQRFRRLVVRSSYSGPFDLLDRAGGGTMARFMWRRGDTPGSINQSQDLLTYPSEPEIVVDLGRGDLVEYEQAGLPWAGAPGITALRWDPNEDRGARSWALDDVELWQEWTAFQRFGVEWGVAAPAPGTRVSVLVDTDRSGCDGVTLVSGAVPRTRPSVAVWDTSRTPAGRYWVCTRTTTSGVTTTRYAQSPVRVVAAQGPAAVSVPVPGVEPSAGGIVARWSLPAPPPGGRTVAVEARLVGDAASTRVLHRDVRATTLPTTTPAQVEVRAVGTGGPGAWSPASARVTPLPVPAPGDESGPGPVFMDVAPDASFRPEIRWMADTRLSVGTLVDGEAWYHPTAPVSRQAMAAFVYRYSGADHVPRAGTQTFTDVPPSHPFYRQIEWLAAQRLTTGYADGSYGGGRPVSRQAMAAFLHRLAGAPPVTGTSGFSDVPAGHTFSAPVTWLAQRGIATGYQDGTFGTTRDVSRQAMAAFLYRYDRSPS